MAIAFGGLVGGFLRWVIEILIPTPGSFPLSTLVINLSGAFVLGFFYRIADENGLRSWIRSGVGTGLIGSFTTFSTFCFETSSLITSNIVLAVLYGLGSLISGLALAYLGNQIAIFLIKHEHRTRETVS
ncbi:fluoride efflux transporter FluC [Alicyclobacillus kakegawensis]|uniref:fluoride efflux transporter FluC n=1 Tax=Alicyclobacillus kakegawensis TaxID=392012 RepID=UPI001FE2092A|nr:CrcB family protein [Alicyclobacillus kakegawensis]